MTDPARDTVNYFFCVFLSQVCSGYTIDMSKCNQSVHGFLTFKVSIESCTCELLVRMKCSQVFEFHSNN